MSSTYTPTKRNTAHATAKDYRASLATAIAAGFAEVDDVALTAASLTTALVGDNNDLVYTANAAGLGGNEITVAYVDPEEETAEESVVVDEKVITVTLRSVSAVLSTAAQVTAAIEADVDADALVSVANAADNTGAGVVTAMAATALTGGTAAKTAEQIVGDAAGLLTGEITRLTSASAVGLEDALHLALALDGAGYLAFYNSAVAALNAIGPEGFDD